ncbi:caldesmon-like [Camellia sinensis]|uniref:caldesmon-like n=1 Tax=Camellia sinensis TaxID=4442 RepID=UPI001035849B|nr:caldesmon-like [Camellia sinensis]
MLSSSDKRVDGVMVVVRGNDLKKVLVSTDDAVLVEIKVALQYFGRPSLQKQGRVAHILLRYKPTYTTFSAAENIPVPRGEEFLTALILTNFKNLRQVGLDRSDSEQAEVAEEVAEESNQSEAEVDEALKLVFEEAGLNSSNPPSTSGRGDVSFDDIFTGLEDLFGAYPEDMAGLSLTQLAKKKNAARMAARQRAEAIRSEFPPVADAEPSLPIVEEETAQTQTAELEQVEQANQEVEQRGEKRPAEKEAESVEEQTDKWPRIEESDLVVPFTVQPKIRNMPISSDTSALKDPAVALIMASSISLPVDRAVFRAEPDLLSIALAAQLALLMVGKIAEIGRRQHDAIEHITLLKIEVKNEKNKAVEGSQRADSEAAKAAEERARADSEAESARNFDQLRLSVEDREKASEDALQLAKEVIAKLEADLEESKKAKEKADFEVSKAFQAGQEAALESYADEVPKFKNRGFKHSWLKALAATNVT